MSHCHKTVNCYVNWYCRLDVDKTGVNQDKVYWSNCGSSVIMASKIGKV